MKSCSELFRFNLNDLLMRKINENDETFLLFSDFLRF